jgi:RNA polymerase sigma factor (sigma-70 family)
MGHHLIEGRAIFPDHALVLSQDLMDGDGQNIHVRVQWLDWPATEDSYLVVLLDDPTQTAEATARLEALRYNLTPREREVWVLRQANQSYEAIAQALYISVNTVKRHLKSIYAKRKQVLDDQELHGQGLRGQGFHA